MLVELIFVHKKLHLLECFSEVLALHMTPLREFGVYSKVGMLNLKYWINP